MTVSLASYPNQSMRTVFAYLCLSLLISVPAFAADDFVAERRQVLEKIVTLLENRHSIGLDDGSELISAKLSLFTFERDSAVKTHDRISWQQKIVKLQEEELTKLENKFSAGLVPDLELLRAKDRLLAARCELAKMQKR